MKAVSNVTKKTLLSDKAKTATVLIGIILSVSLLLTSLSFYFGFATYLEGIKNYYTSKGIIVEKIPLSFFINNATELLKGEPINAGEEQEGEDTENEKLFPEVIDAREVFSTEAIVANMPSALAALLIITALVSFLSIRISFLITRKERRKLFAMLLSIGATKKHIKQSVFYETLWLSAIGVPAGIVFGVAETLILKAVMKTIFLKMSEPFSIEVFPVKISVSLVAILISALFGFVVTFLCAKATSRKLMKQSIVSSINSKGTSLNGIRCFSPSDAAYKTFGVERHIASRNFSEGLGKYFLVMLMISSFVTIFILTSHFFNIVLAYNESVFDSGYTIEESAEESEEESVIMAQKEIGMVFALEIYFCCMAASLSIVSLVGTFNMILLNIYSNFGQYALVTSVGASLKSICKIARTEGLICAGAALGLSWFFCFFVVALAAQTVNGVDFFSFFTSGILLVVSAAGVIGTVILAIVFTRKKLLKTDLIEVLKDESY